MQTKIGPLREPRRSVKRFPALNPM
jgi:hypothetical protein